MRPSVTQTTGLGPVWAVDGDPPARYVGAADFDMWLLLSIACLPPILPDTGVVADSGDQTDTSDTANPIDADGDGSAADADCDDADPARYPGAPEALNFLDEDCDGTASEFVTDMAGNLETTNVGLLRAMEAFPDDPTSRVAASLSGNNSVIVAAAADLADGSLDSALVLTASGADELGFDLESGDVDGDGLVDLLVGDPGAPSRYSFLDSGALGRSGSLSIEGQPAVVDDNGGGRVGAAAAILGGSPSVLAITDVSATDSAVFLLSASDLGQTLVTEVETGRRIGSEGGAPSFGLALGHAELNGTTPEELLVGAPGAERTSGAVYRFDGDLVAGSGDLVSTAADAVITGIAVGDALGGGFLPAGDPNHDGHQDVWLTTYAHSSGTRTFYLLMGGTAWPSGDVDTVAHASIAEIRTFDEGGSVPVSYLSAAAADVDDDDANELFLGSVSEGSNGHVLVFSGATAGAGGALAASDAGLDIVGSAIDDGFGQSVAIVAPGESSGLLIVGAPGVDEGALWTLPLAF